MAERSSGWRTLELHGLHPADSSLGIVPTFSTYLVVLTGIILLIALIVSERRRGRETHLA